jgi:uncharacterized cysteine cluster protein YcgN (CxxCxxCC family)
MPDASIPDPDTPFWESKPMEDLSPGQWEALCDGCGKCCLHKYEDEDDGSMHYTNVSCRLLDTDLCRCTDYANRAAQVDDCIQLTPETLRNPAWLPQTCAYRLIREGRPLPDWHYLICGDRDAVHRAGASVRGRVVCETQVDDPLMHLVDWVR